MGGSPLQPRHHHGRKRVHACGCHHTHVTRTRTRTTTQRHVALVKHQRTCPYCRAVLTRANQIKLLRARAEKGYVEAQFRLGHAYARGDMVAQDIRVGGNSKGVVPPFEGMGVCRPPARP